VLRTSFEQGRDAALDHYGLKLAIAMPAALTGLSARLARPAKKALGLGALGAAGALGYSLHKQTNDGQGRDGLVYAPMTGGFTG
jgi:hypothetical protein